MAQLLVNWVREEKRFTGQATLETAATLTGNTVTINELHTGEEIEAGAASVVATGGITAPGIASEWDIYYIPATPPDPGEYTFALTYSYNDVTKTFVDEVEVFPQWSEFDPYISRIKRLLRDNGGGDVNQRNSQRDFKDAVIAGAEEYSRHRWRKVYQDYTLTSAWAYTLPTGTAYTPDAPWVDEFSEVVKVEYPYDVTVQTQTFLDPHDITIDPYSNQWRFANHTPEVGKVARFYYKGRHVISHTENTLPRINQPFYNPFCLWVAGHMMATVEASEKATTSDPSEGQGMVNYGTQFERVIKLGEMMKTQAIRQIRPRTFYL